MVTQEVSYNTTSSTNSNYNTPSVLQIRLDTQSIIEDCELFLRGAYIAYERDEKTGEVSKALKEDSKARKVNKEGVYSILNRLRMVVNPQVVQGNFPSDGKGISIMYQNYIYELRMSLTEMIIINARTWNVRDSDIELLVDGLMDLIEPFMTRLIDNMERDSYDTIKQTDTVVRGPNEGVKLGKV